MSLKKTEPLFLSTLIEYLIYEKENRRSLDYFASIFLFYLKVFKIRNVFQNIPLSHQTLMTKEVVWALHTN